MKRLIKYTVGMILIGLGVASMFYSRKGVSTFDSISHNLVQIFQLDIGLAVLITSTLVLVVAFILTPKLEVVLSFVCTIFLSVLISGFDKLFIYLPTSDILKYIYMVFGVILIPIGAALMIDSNYPPSSVDMFLKAANKRYNIKIGKLKYITEIVFLLTSLTLGFISRKSDPSATFGLGLGTIVLLLISGLVMQITLNLLRRSKNNEN